MKSNKISITILLLIFGINVNYCQNRNFNHGVLIGLNQTYQHGLKFKIYDENSTDRVYSIPNNYEEKYGLKAGYYINYSLNSYLSINMETSIDWSRLAIGYDKTNSLIQSGIIYSKQEGNLNLSDVSINLPLDLHWKPYKGIYVISGFNLKFLLDDKNEWKYHEQILYDKVNNQPTTFTILPETSENFNTNRINYALRFGLGLKNIESKIRLEAIIKHEFLEYINTPSFKKTYLELNMKIDLNKKRQTE